MSTKRSYHDGCAAAQALDLVGERWTLLVVRELLFGPRRFTDLRSGLPAISPNVLSQRLDELEQSAIVRRHKLPPPANTWVYELTEWGRELDVVITELGRWGARSPFLKRDLELSIHSLVMSLRTMFQGETARGVHARYELRMGDYAFDAVIDDGTFEVSCTPAGNADAVITADPASLAAVVYDGRPLAEAIAAGEVSVDGALDAVERFRGYFALPDRAPA